MVGKDQESLQGGNGKREEWKSQINRMENGLEKMKNVTKIVLD